MRGCSRIRPARTAMLTSTRTLRQTTERPGRVHPARDARGRRRHGHPRRHGDHGVAVVLRGTRAPTPASRRCSTRCARRARPQSVSGGTCESSVHRARRDSDGRGIDIDAGGGQTGTTVLRTVEFENRRAVPAAARTCRTRRTRSARSAAALRSALADADVHERRHASWTQQRRRPERHRLSVDSGANRNSARAITVFGATALIRAWRWNGREWVE